MMKTAGHTMGTPELTVEDAAVLFSNMGMDGMEIILQENYKCGFQPDITDRQVMTYAQFIRNLGLEVSCIVSYASDYNQPDETKRNAAISECKRCIEIAHMLESRHIRIYGGTFLDGDEDFSGKRKILVSTMVYLADIAKKAGVGLVLENHFNTMTTGPAITYEIVKEINRDNVGILYDQANISFLSGEGYKESIQIQKDKIDYVHVKDFVFKKEGVRFQAGSVSHVKESERAVSSRIPGDGIVQWPEIIKELYAIGYDGFLSFEYERRWHPNDLPPAEIGMKKGLEYIKTLI